MSVPSAATWLPRIEDWVLTGWVAIVLPVLGRGHVGGADVLPTDRPLDGVLDLVAIAGVAACVVLRRAEPRQPAENGPTISAAVGPLTGGVLLVAIAGSTALALPDWAGLGLAVAAAIALVVGRLRLPPTSVAVRRALMTPFILATGGLFSRFVDAVTGSFPSGGDPGVTYPGPVVPVLILLLMASAVWYAMLVYAPRQVAEREGSPISWLVRYGLFVGGTALGLAGLAVLGG